ncbi:MAG TPA: hypothetical protein VIK91_12105, partial [Nannocystis sp.]
MTTTKHHSRWRASEPGRAGERTSGHGLLARVLGRVRAWLGGRAIRNLRGEAWRVTDAVREHARSLRRHACAALGTSRSVRPPARRRDEPRRFVPESQPLGYVPTPQPWPWRFMSHGVPWAPGPEPHGPPFWTFHPGPPYAFA